MVSSVIPEPQEGQLKLLGRSRQEDAQCLDSTAKSSRTHRFSLAPLEVVLSLGLYFLPEMGQRASRVLGQIPYH